MSPILATVRERVAMFEDVVALDPSSVALCVVCRFAACIPQVCMYLLRVPGRRTSMDLPRLVLNLENH